jgi:hypothetical protein
MNIKKYNVWIEFEGYALVEATSKKEAAEKAYDKLRAYNLSFEDFLYSFEFDEENDDEEDYFELEND